MTADQKPEQPMLASEYSEGFREVLALFGISLAVSTYQAGQLVMISATQDAVATSFVPLMRPMGIAVHDEAIAVADFTAVHFYRKHGAIVSQIRPKGVHDAAFTLRKSMYTNAIDAHELVFLNNSPIIVNTAFSMLCTLQDGESFVEVWRPRFIRSSHMQAIDACHLNGIAVDYGSAPQRARYVTALGASDMREGWRESKSGGILIDVASNEIAISDLDRPHSPRIHADRLYLLESGQGALVEADIEKRQLTQVARFHGFTRGLALHSNVAFVGLSKLRDKSEHGDSDVLVYDEMTCGIAAVDLNTGDEIGRLTFVDEVNEIFDVRVVKHRRPILLDIRHRAFFDAYHLTSPS